MSSVLNGQESEEDSNSPVDKTGVLVRIPAPELAAFKALNPWHGGITQFFLQCLREYLALAEGQKTPAQVTTEAVKNVFRDGY